jgi:DNA polymerase-3 subunit beta
MNIICTQENLKAGLATVGKIISSSSTLPVLNNVLLKTESGMLKISSTNLEVAITTHIRCKVEDEGVITVNSKTFTDLVNNLPNKNIVLKTTAEELQVESENYKSVIKTMSFEEFPLIPEVESQNSFTVKAQEFKNTIAKVVFAASTNQTQPEISGILIALDSGIMRVVATDRYRLAEKKQPYNNSSNVEVIIPQKTINEISRIISNQDGDMVVGLSGNQIAFQIGSTQIISRLLDGQYPDYRQIIPTSFLTTLSLDRQQFVSALRAGGIFSQSSNSVKVEYFSSKQKIVLTAESGDLGKSVIELEAEVSGNDGMLLVNYHYLLDCLVNLETERVVLKIMDENSPSLITPEGDNTYIYLVMPIKS